jgi:dipeptidyl aminopeptidase/acylaminoacyl peptidase
MQIAAPEGAKLSDPTVGQFELSPDGRRLAFIAVGADGKSRIWLRPLDRENAGPLAGTEGATVFPFWSPDSRWLAFFANGRLQKIDVANGGPPQPICDCGPAGYATWNSDGTILFNAFDQPIQRVPASGGNPAPVFGFDLGRGEKRQIAPYALPDGKQFVYLSFGKETVVVLASLDGKRRRVLFPGETTVSYVANPAGGGWLLYNLQEQLFAKTF